MSRSDDTRAAVDALLTTADSTPRLKTWQPPEGLTIPEVFEIMDRIGRDAATLHRLYLVAMNDHEVTDRELQQVARCQARIRARAELLGCPVEFNDDARGCAVSLTLPSGRSNSFGGTGWGL